MTSTAGTLAATVAARVSARSRHADRRGGDHRLAVGHSLDESARSPMKLSLSTLNPKSFGSWPTRMVIARPFM